MDGVYTQTNDAERNEVVAFRRAADGGLSPMGGLSAPPQARTGPLIVAEPEATVRISLGFEPASVQISAAGRRFEPAASRDLNWKVPSHAPQRSFLQLNATRLVDGRPSADHASYVARLRISG